VPRKMPDFRIEIGPSISFWQLNVIEIEYVLKFIASSSQVIDLIQIERNDA
jgi:hypothetical protein